VIRISNLRYSYPERSENSLNSISLTVEDGEFAILKGLSGSGKTTLLRSINGIVPFFYGGRISGSVEVDGISTRHDVRNVRKRVGLLFQDPENQIVMSSVKREIAFGMENLGFERKEIVEFMNDIYENEWSCLFNFYIPSMKLISKQRVGSKVIKKHSLPMTPLQRLIESGAITKKRAGELKRMADSLDPFKLQKSIEKKIKYILGYVNERF
jgi:ABC-type sugar transport system ATPase subunit